MNDTDKALLRVESDPFDAIEVTSAMIAAGARVLMEDDYLSELLCEAYIGRLWTNPAYKRRVVSQFRFLSSRSFGGGRG